MAYTYNPFHSYGDTAADVGTAAAIVQKVLTGSNGSGSNPPNAPNAMTSTAPTAAATSAIPGIGLALGLGLLLYLTSRGSHAAPV
jgi:hypothetical protein